MERDPLFKPLVYKNHTLHRCGYKKEDKKDKRDLFDGLHNPVNMPMQRNHTGQLAGPAQGAIGQLGRQPLWPPSVEQRRLDGRQRHFRRAEDHAITRRQQKAICDKIGVRRLRFGKEGRSRRQLVVEL